MDAAGKVVYHEHNIKWLPEPNEGFTLLSSQLPPLELISTSLALAFDGDRLLVTNLVKRGWDIPGGHIEAGEHPEQTVRREVMEETGATLEALQLLGYQHLRLLGPRPDGYHYPYPEAYQVFYRARVATLRDFVPTAETYGRGFLTPADVHTLKWVQHNRVLYETALQAFAR
jgi:8-oxo-dGTP diphosphatase